MEKRGWLDDTVYGCGVTTVDSGITVISDDLCVDKIRDGGHRCRPVESSRWHWSEGFNRGPRLVRSPRTSWLSNLGHGARYALFSIPALSIRVGSHPVSFFSLLSSIKSRPIIVAARFHGILNLSAAEKNIFEQPNREKRYLNVHKDIPVRILARISGCSRSCSCITVNTTSVATVVR